MTASSLNSNRRQELQNRRKLKFWQAVWRSLVASSIASGLFWAIALPEWVIEQQNQIEIEGNQFLSEEELRTLLPLAYPQPILQLRTQRLAQQFQTTAPVEEATLSRQLFPPKLIITVHERPPVAIVLSSPPKAPRAEPTAIGFIDEQGILVPQNFYTQLDQAALPTLKLIGFEKQHRPYWTQLYHLIERSSVKVSAVDWRTPGNLIIQTELGTVHLGANFSKLPEQFAVLSQLRVLPNRLQTKSIDYIELTNPALPEIQLKKSAAPR